MKEIEVVNASRPILVDDEDYGLLAQYRWQRSGNTFATIVEGAIVTINKLLSQGNVHPKDGDIFNRQRANLQRIGIRHMVTHR